MIYKINQLTYIIKVTKLYIDHNHNGLRISIYSTMNKNGKLYKEPKLDYSFTIFNNTMIKDFSAFVKYINKLDVNLKKQIEKDKL